jgi:hypothetical protein
MIVCLNLKSPLIITAACSFGTKDFIKTRLKERKDKYSISEIIEITEDQYGNTEFKEYFKR